MHAATQSSTGGQTVDSDGDGLPDLLELRMGTNDQRADSDFDGFSDSEELARTTSPTRGSSLPAARRLSVGMSVFGHDGILHVVSALYVEDGNLDTINFTLGLRIGDRLRPLPADWWSNEARISVQPAQDSRDLIYLIDYPLSPALVHSLGSLSMYAIVGDQETAQTCCAAAVDLLSATDGVVVQIKAPNGWAEMGISSQGTTSPGGAFGPAGSIYAPIPVDEDEENGGGLPSTWTPAQVCAQRSTVVGASGAVTTHEVVQADCVDDLDSFCDPGCASTVGATYQTIDPLVLVGG